MSQLAMSGPMQPRVLIGVFVSYCVFFLMYFDPKNHLK